jgi:hypothetical protein
MVLRLNYSNNIDVKIIRLFKRLYIIIEYNQS